MKPIELKDLKKEATFIFNAFGQVDIMIGEDGKLYCGIDLANDKDITIKETLNGSKKEEK